MCTRLLLFSETWRARSCLYLLAMYFIFCEFGKATVKKSLIHIHHQQSLSERFARPMRKHLSSDLEGGKMISPVPEHSRGRLHGAVLTFHVTVTHTNIHKCVDKSNKILSREIRYQRFGPQPQCLTLWASLCVSGCVWAGQLFGLIPPWGHSLLLITSVTHFSPVFLFPLIISPPFFPRLSASFLVLPLFSCV